MIKIPKVGEISSELTNSRVAVMDADSIAHIVSYNHKERDNVDAALKNVDEFIHTIFQATQVRFYIGVLAYKTIGNQQPENFRNAIAVTKEYKGTRGEKPEWYNKWAPYIENHLIDHWGFFRVPFNVEADDMVVTLHQQLRLVPTCTPVLCGNDKDCLQSEGEHYNFRKNLPQTVTLVQSHYNLFYQVLMGDKEDCIPGLTGCGKVGAAKILDNPELGPDNYHVAVLYEYVQKLGIDKGIQSYYENYMLCKMRDDLDTSAYHLTPYDLDKHAVRSYMNLSNTSEMGDLTQEIEAIDFLQPDIDEDNLFVVD